MKPGLACGWGALLVGLFVAPAPAVEVTPAEAQNPPTAGWVAGVLDARPEVSWTEIARAAADAGVRAGQNRRTTAMEAWLNLARWARILGADQRFVVQRWIEALNTAQLGHANLPRRFELPAATMSTRYSRDFVEWLLSEVELSQSLFDVLTPYDYLPGVLDILQRLQQTGGADFETYRELGIAIAIVFVEPAPPHWPHGQVGSKVLPRERPDPVEAFAFWTEADRRRKTLHHLNRLSASELKFVVDAAAPFAELVWAQQQTTFNLESLAQAYDAVTYATDRAEREVYQWPGRDYRLATILATGGICIDQAYFASEVGKAKGVPTLLFRGAGLDGRHAWFGYLDDRQNWRLDAGRYAEQKLVSGVALDPQTWGDVSDHELHFLAERFRRLPGYRQSRAWQALAQEYLRRGDAAAAVTAARRSTNTEPRNVYAWEVLTLAERAAQVPVVKREATLRKAAWALQRYPDLYVRFMREVIAAMRERGQASAADHEEQMLVQKFRVDRGDLAVQQAADLLNRAMAEDSPAVQLQVFQAALRQFGVGAGMKAFDSLVEPLFRQAMAEHRAADAAQVLDITRRHLSIEAGSQFAKVMDALAAQLR